MGPYCKYCGTRCFVPITFDWPAHIADAYKPYTIAATCPDGQAAEKRALGWCYNDARSMMDPDFATVRLVLQKILRERTELELLLRTGGYTEDELRAAARIIRHATMNLLGAMEELLPALEQRYPEPKREVQNGV